MNAKPWKHGIHDDNRTVKQIYGSREVIENIFLNGGAMRRLNKC